MTGSPTAHWAAVWVFVLVLIWGCGGEGRDTPLGFEPGATGFVDRTAFSGIDFVNHTGREREKIYIVEAKGGGSLCLDYDGDGRLDLYAVDGNMFRLDPQGRVLSRTTNPKAGNRLYRNLGGWRFEDVTERAGVGDTGYGFGGGVADYDGDGDTDIYVCNWGRNLLYRNNGDGTFTDVAEQAGVRGADDLYSTGATFFDADRDGDLDLYVSNYNDVEEYMVRTKGAGLVPNGFGYPVIAGPGGITPVRDIFYRNRGDGTFVDESGTALRNQIPRYSFTSVVTDVNLDGWPDLYVATDMNPNTLWLNDGTGCFDDAGAKAGAAVNGFGANQAGMGSDSIDWNQDGWPDLFTTNYLQDDNTLYRNLTGEVGTVFFEDVTAKVGLAEGDRMKVCWATKLADFDRDGFVDIFIVAGHFYDTDSYVLQEGAGYRQYPSLWFGEGPPDYGFRVALREERGAGMLIPKVGRGGCFGDFDNDGDVDVYIAALDDRPLLLENRLPRHGHWLMLGLVGAGGNRDAIGARVTVHAGNGRVRLLQEMRRSSGFLGSDDPRLFWGLGSARRADRIEVVWPDGRCQEFRDIAGDAYYRLEEGGSLVLDPTVGEQHE